MSISVSSARPAASQTGRVATALACTAVGAATAIASVSSMNPNESNALGLISALPTLYFVGTGLVILSFLAMLRRENLNRPVLALQLLTIITLLFGLASYVEDIARLPTTWVHVGFVDYIQRHDAVLENYDARFSWPGFFAAGAMLNVLAGTGTQLAVLAWTPLVLNLCFALPVWQIARSTGASARTSWLATLLFFFVNWVGQDYYSPQGLNFLLALTFLAVLLRAFSAKSSLLPDRAKGKLANWVRARGFEPATLDPLELTSPQRVGLLLALLVIYGASVASHQLTPFFLIVITLGLVLFNRVSLRTLPALMLLLVFMWIGYMATSFWVGQSSQLFGDVGQVGGVVDQSVNNRVTGDPDHLPVVYGRLLLAFSVWAAALFGLLRRLRNGKVDMICLVGFIAPFSVLAGQAYGGEAMLRIYLFALPFAVTLAACAIAPEAKAWSLKKTALIGALCLALLPAFFITRYGNEAFEQFDGAELALVQQVHTAAPDGSTLLYLNSLIPSRGQNIQNEKYVSIAEDGPPPDIVKALDDGIAETGSGNKYLIITRAQKRYAELTHGQSSTWADDMAAQIVATGRFRVMFENSQGQVIVPEGQL